MEFSQHRSDLGTFPGDGIVVFAASDRELEGALRDLDAAAGGALAALRARKAFKGETGEIVVLPLAGGEKLGIVVGIGPYDQADRFRLRRAAAVGARKAQALGCRVVGVAPAEAPCGPVAAAEAALIGAGAGAYRMRRYKTDDAPQGIEQLGLIGDFEADAALRARAIAEGVAIARELVDTPPNDKTPDLLSLRAAELAQAAGLQCEIVGAAQLEAMGAGGILAVGRGSAHPPALVVLRHDGGEGPWHGFLGKGITFDSGGLDLKTQEGMLDMKSDMAGTAAVLGAMHALSRLRVPGRYIGILALAENMTGTGAYRPSDVLHMLSGDTVEVSNTDAEGRLVLADGLAWLRREGVGDIIDLATLTGAIVVALGTHRSGLFANDDGHAAAVEAAANLAGERYWRMPIDPEHKEALKSPIADTKSTGGRPGGSSTAAAFLGRFAADTPWVHLDIAGAAFRSQPGELGEGATGVGVETLVRFATKA